MAEIKTSFSSTVRGVATKPAISTENSVRDVKSNSGRIFNKLKSQTDQSYYKTLLENTVDEILTNPAKLRNGLEAAESQESAVNKSVLSAEIQTQQRQVKRLGEASR